MERDERLRADLNALRMDRDAALPGAARSARRRWPRWAIGAAALILAAVLLLLATGRPAEVAIASAVAGEAGADARAPVLSGSGYIVPGDKVVAIGARIPGVVERFLVDEGQSVKAGDPLVQLDDREYRAVLDRVQAQLASARAELSLASAELARGEELFRRDFLSERELDVRRNRVAVARARLAELDAAVREAEVNLGYTLLRAPTDGIVLAKLKEAGEIAVPGGFQGSGELVRLANLHDLRAEIDVNESDLSLVRLGQAAEITPDADPTARYAGEVVKLYPQVDRQKGTLKVEVRVLEPGGKLLPDMSARVSFLGEPEAAATGGSIVLIPVGALRRAEDGATYVFVVDEGRAVRRDVVEAGLRGDQVRVRSGLELGESVVVGDTALRDGQRVRAAAPPP